MFNPYVIILSLFIIAGLYASYMGWRIIQKGRKTLAWPQTPGEITSSQAASNVDDLMPLIEFSYTIDDKAFHKSMEFSSGVTPSQELTSQYLQRYPAGHRVMVFYDPDNHENATIEPGMGNGDWFVLAIGIITTFFGIIFLFFSN